MPAKTDHLLDHARAKLARKRCDMIVLNDVGPASGTFGGDSNEVTIVTPDDAVSWPRLSKAEIATRLIQLLADRLGSGS